MKLDILVLAAHPDDAELSCSGTIAAHIAKGKKVGIVDFTQGELGTRGSAEIRKQEAEEASRILEISARENLKMADGFFQNDQANQLKVIQAIRTYQPEIIFTNALNDRHIDHGKGAKLAHESCFLSGLRKIETFDAVGKPQEAWRPKALYHYIQDYYLKPDLVIDITNFWEIKVAAIRAFKTQFYDPNSDEPITPISTPDFLDFLEARAREMGRMIGVKYGEGFNKAMPIGAKSMFDLL